MTGADPGRVRVEPVRREWADALSHGDAEFTRRFGVPVEAGWAGFPEALPITIAAARGGEPDEWGPHLFFGEDGALIGNGGWKGAPVDGAAELGYAVAPARQGQGVATAVVCQLVARACCWEDAPVRGSSPPWRVLRTGGLAARVRPRSSRRR